MPPPGLRTFVVHTSAAICCFRNAIHADMFSLFRYARFEYDGFVTSSMMYSVWSGCDSDFVHRVLGGSLVDKENRRAEFSHRVTHRPGGVSTVAFCASFARNRICSLLSIHIISSYTTGDLEFVRQPHPQLIKPVASLESLPLPADHTLWENSMTTVRHHPQSSTRDWWRCADSPTAAYLAFCGPKTHSAMPTLLPRPSLTNRS
ncbi:hypothetical protein FKP32DRAFT_807251 [Trametes sanguinea]|nr:hypothetical protein FKP32DRAFT_807251 [Trametes sanguinea]